ncbi:MAG: AmmeMemoRadiSam system protein B, partial [Bacillota bacterium]|nr:AmmeMemoRadiSam system protein B [Bacillota bacterium]
MSISFMAYCPHPAIIVPEVGGSETAKVKKTMTAMENLAESIQEKGEDIETVICITPHGPIFQDAITIWQTESLSGRLAKFGASQIKLSFRNDLELAKAIVKHAEAKRIISAQLNLQLADSYNIDLALDHGITVPLYFLRRGISEKVKLVPISIGLLSYQELYSYGMAIRDSIEETGKKVAVIVSGDLSHCLTETAPGGFHPKGQEFDQKLVSFVEAGDVLSLMSIDSELIEFAGECGFRPLVMALGILDKSSFDTRVLSYEAPFGVGYLVAEFHIKEGTEPS